MKTIGKDKQKEKEIGFDLGQFATIMVLLVASWAFFMGYHGIDLAMNASITGRFDGMDCGTLGCFSYKDVYQKSVSMIFLGFGLLWILFAFRF